MILWTRRPFDRGERHVLTVDVAADEAFRRIVATAPAPVSAAADWTCRVLVAGLRPATTYWYRFTDEDGNGSRVGRTITSPDESRHAAREFAFVSCQSVNDGTLNAYRRMIFEDEKAGARRPARLRAPLGDFIYEVIWYPEDLKTLTTDGLRGRPHPDAGKVANLHFPLTLEGYRTVYRATCATPTSRTRAPAGRSSACGTTTSSRGWDGRASSSRASSSGWPDRQGRRQSGVVRVPARARGQAEQHLAGDVRSAGGEGRQDRALR